MCHLSLLFQLRSDVVSSYQSCAPQGSTNVSHVTSPIKLYIYSYPIVKRDEKANHECHSGKKFEILLLRRSATVFARVTTVTTVSLETTLLLGCVVIEMHG
jgi:hypothetical protein